MGFFDFLKREKTLGERVSGWMRGDFSSKTIDVGHAAGKGLDGAARIAQKAKDVHDTGKAAVEAIKIASKSQRW